MRISTLRIGIFALIPFLSIASTYADTEIIPSPDPQCNQYFDAGYVYEGDNGKELFDVVRDIGSNELDLYQDEQISPIIDTSWLTAVSYTIPEFRYATDFLTNCGGNWCVGGASGRQFSYLTSGQAFKWIETIPGKHLQVVSIDKSKVNDANRAQIRDKYFKIKYTIKGHFWSDASSSFVGDFNHVECQQIGAHFCGDGVVEPGRETCDPAAPGQSPASCDVNTCQPIVQQPTCNSISITPTAGTIPVDSAVSCNTSNETSVAIDCGNGQMIDGKTGTCNYITVGTFAPRCIVNGSITGPACTASVTTTPAVPTPYVSIKKYVKTLNAAGDTQTAPVSIARGEAFSYYYQLQNTGSVAATGVVVKDTLPSYLTYSGVIRVTDPAGTDVTADWTTLTGSTVFVGETLPRIWLVLSKKTDLPANSGLYTFTIPVVLATTAPVFVNMQNVVYACAANQVSNPTGPNGEVICGNVNPPPPPPPAQCDQTNPNSQKDPACIVVTGTGFDLSLKKYIGINDAQVGSPLSVSNGAVLNYVIRVTNSGPESSSGVTTVQDILPTGIILDGTVSGTSWTCSATSVTITCTSTLIVGSGASYPDITVPFRVTATAGQTVTNIAAVDNPLEVNRCMTTTSLLPTTSSSYCTRDTLNSDPAVLTVSWGPTGGSSNIGKKCINGIASCASYNTIAACIADGIPAALCYPADAVGQNMCTVQSLSCSGPGGGGWGSYVGWSCGDGVLGSSPGEECDVVWAPWCVSCKIDLKTNPGANPITDLWMTIPVLAGTQRPGYTWLDGAPGKVAFSDNRMVLGVGTKAFTLADTVWFGIRTQYRIPLIIEANKKICLKSEGSSLNSQDICTTFGEAANSNPTIEVWQRADGVEFVNIGVGDYQKINPIPQPPMPSQLPLIHTTSQQADYDAAVQAHIDWRQYIPVYSSSANNITLFRWPVQYSSLQNNNIGPTLNSAFFGMIPGNDSTIWLFTDTGVDLVKLAVRVSGAVVSTIGSSSNRAIESFINTRDIFVGFLGTTIGYTSTTSNNTTTATTTVALPTLVGAAGTTVSSVADLEQRYAVNGNKNILAVTGDLTITCPAGSTVFTMTGVRTVIVTGNLIIRCNIVYGSSDSTSSWAWIAKNGNIQVYNGTGTPNVGAVTNLAGVYVTVKETTGGDITYTGANTTQAILRVEGTLYGNASPLFASRLYARATWAYDILTTGTILTYSNRALVSPPPLLSQYLGTYQVQRVVQ